MNTEPASPMMDEPMSVDSLIDPSTSLIRRARELEGLSDAELLALHFRVQDEFRARSRAIFKRTFDDELIVQSREQEE